MSEEYSEGLMGVPEKEYVASIIKMVDEIEQGTDGSEVAFSEALEASMLEQVDSRSRDLLRAEKEGVLKSARGTNIFSQSIEDANNKIADLRSKIDGRPPEEHLAEIKEDDRKPDEGFFDSLLRGSDKRIAALKEEIERESPERAKPAEEKTAPKEEDKGFFSAAVDAVDESIESLKRRIAGEDEVAIDKPGKEAPIKPQATERTGPERDDLQQARTKAKTKEKELSPEEKIKRTREKLRLTELKLQAYKELAGILKGHISKLEKSIAKGGDISEKEVKKLSKFKTAVEKFEKQIGVLSKSKKDLTKEQQENLKRQKIEKYRQLEQKMKAKRKELEAAQRAERAAADDRSYAGFILPGDFLKVVRQEQEQAAAAKSDAVEAEIGSLASEIEQNSKLDTDVKVGTAKSAATSVASAAKSDVAKAQMMDGVDTSAKAVGADASKATADKVASRAASIDAALGIGGGAAKKSVSKPPSTPVTAEVKQRKAQEAKDYDPTYYSRKKEKK